MTTRRHLSILRWTFAITQRFLTPNQYIGDTMKTNENVTLKTTSDLTAFLYALDRADIAENERFNETEKALGFLKALRMQYKTLQHGNAKGNPKIGELPSSIYIPVITGLYESKENAAKLKGEDFTLKFENFRDFQVRSLKFYLETGELFNRKKDTLQERALVAIDKLEKKLKADQAKAEKEKAKAEKEKAKAGKIIANNKTKIKEAAELKADLITAPPTPEVKEILEFADNVIETAKKDAVKAHNAAADAVDDANDAAIQVVKTTTQLAKAKEKLEKLSAPKPASAGKADNNQQDPKLDFMTTNFSQDCKDIAAEMFEYVENEYKPSNAEWLYLAKIILDKYNK